MVGTRTRSQGRNGTIEYEETHRLTLISTHMYMPRHRYMYAHWCSASSLSLVRGLRRHLDGKSLSSDTT